jgi:hypothetical protein
MQGSEIERWNINELMSMPARFSFGIIGFSFSSFRFSEV